MSGCFGSVLNVLFQLLLFVLSVGLAFQPLTWMFGTSSTWLLIGAVPIGIVLFLIVRVAISFVIEGLIHMFRAFTENR